MSDMARTTTVTVMNSKGLHLRPADVLVKKAQEFDSTIAIVRDGERFNVKSVLEIMTLGAVQGTELQLEAQGGDAEQAIQELAAMFDCGFNETENEH